MTQGERSEYTSEEAILLAMKTLRSTQPDAKVLVVIEEIEREAREGRKLAGKLRPGDRVSVKRSSGGGKHRYWG